MLPSCSTRRPYPSTLVVESPQKPFTNMSEDISRVEAVPRTPYKLKASSKVDSRAVMHNGVNYPHGSNNHKTGRQKNLSSSAEVLGQFSFAPATQTTIVTTTTTTTTNFPPLIMRAPNHLHQLDAKLYPLAASPTPSTLKKLKFNLEGKPILFCEADDAESTLHNVSFNSNLVTISSEKSLIKGK